MKKWIVFSLVLCLLFCLSACISSYQLNEQGLPVISSSLRNKLNQVLKEYDAVYFDGFSDHVYNAWGTAEAVNAWCTARTAGKLAKGGNNRIRYYGNFNGYDIVFYEYVRPLTYMDAKSVGDYIFIHGWSFAIVGHKDGVVYELEELYNNGEISDEALTEIYHYHELYININRQAE